MSLTNNDLREKYDQIFRDGAYEKYFTFNSYEIFKGIVDSVDNWDGLDVLDLGCGEGDLSAMMAFAGAKSVHAIDYSAEALKRAEQRINLDSIRYELLDGKDVEGNYDVIVMAGVLEHIDAPFELLERLITINLRPGGRIISASPSFMNPRGYVWMALMKMLDVPMSLSDVHFFSPTDFTVFGEKYDDVSVETSTICKDWGGGERTILDYRKRLTNALADKGLSNDKVEDFLVWFADALSFYDHNDFSGAIMLNKFTKR